MQVSKKILQSKYLIFSVFLIIIIISYYRVNLKYKSVYEGSENEFELTVISKKYKDEKYTIIFNGDERLISYVKDFPYDVGDIIKVKGNLSKPKSNTIFNTFNYQKYLQSRGIVWELNISETKIIIRNNSIINKLRNYLYNRINNFKYHEYLYVFILGDTSFFSKETRNNYQTCGLSYLLSIGSIQVMMITRLLKCILGNFKVKKKYSLIINIIVVLFYILFTSKIIGVLRSGLCYIFSSILKYYKIKYKYQNIIFIIGILLLLVNPYYIVNVGFLYSFTVSIIISLNQKIAQDSYFKRLFKISIIAFVASLPITIYCNYEINFLACVFSFIFVPIFSFIIFPLSIIVFIFTFLSPLYYFIISFLEYMIGIFSKIDIFIFIFKKPTMLVIIIYYLIIVRIMFNKKNILLLLLVLVIHSNINKIVDEKIITFLDVGEADAIILKNKDKLILLDTGGNYYYNYADNIIKYIKSLGIGKINSIILSHGDFDHIGEAKEIIQNFKVEQVIFNCGNNSYLEQELIKFIDKKKIIYYSCIREKYFGNTKLIFLKTEEYNDENDNSNIIYTKVNGFSFLFMGDASNVVEKNIINNYSIANIDVLKVGHHGSKTSSGKDFIDRIKPKYAVISVGKNNQYNHPSADVLRHLEKSKIYRTDINGSIEFIIKRSKLQINTTN